MAPSIKLDRLRRYKRLLQTPTDPHIQDRIGHRITCPGVEGRRRTEGYVRRVTAFLMYKDLDRDGDL